jgi:outer membrane receptor for ferrienterochelin and colicins
MKEKLIFFFCIIAILKANAQNNIPVADTIKRANLHTVVITQKGNGNNLQHQSILKKEKLTQQELKKNACCNLAESFETNPTVEVNYNNAITGSKQIQMLGLAGNYVQLLTDLLPTIRGLNYDNGLNNIPGSFVQSISIIKGAGSVTNGFESMTGQIDVELMKPEKMSKLYVNGYLNQFLRSEINMHYAGAINPRWSSAIQLHGSLLKNKIDGNKDGFLDRPLYHQLNGVHRWKYNSYNHIESLFGIKGLIDNKSGGQNTFDSNRQNINTNIYGIGIRTTRLELFNKTSYSRNDEMNQSIGLQTIASQHQINSFYGNQNYNGKHNSLFANVIFQTDIKDCDHELKIGVGNLLDDVKETYQNKNYQRTESVTGVFGEYTYTGNEKFSGILGYRLDYNFLHNRFFSTPRANLKISLSESSSIRLSAGNGFRSAFIFAENNALFATNKTVTVLETLNPEQSWNYGGNYSYCFTQFNNLEGRFSLDLYSTKFQNQIIVDYDWIPGSVYFYNLKGRSYANALQAELYGQLSKSIACRIAYKYNDVRSTYHGQLLTKPFVPLQRALFNIAYEWTKRLKVDFTTQWNDKQRLPSLNSNSEIYSPAFFQLLGQITLLLNKCEVYVGSENITNFRQQQVIENINNPFSVDFDGSKVWGPTLGRTFYLGFRYEMN